MDSPAHYYYSNTTPGCVLSKIVVGRGGTIISPAMVADLDQIHNYTELTIKCGRGHLWKSLAGKIEWCRICNLLALMGDKSIVCSQNEYAIGQKKFEFICGHGHHFIGDASSCKNGCRSCNILEIARKKHGSFLMLDILCLNAHDDSRLRFHCIKPRHDPNCKKPECVYIRDNPNANNRDYANSCNLIPCDQDFYATPRQIKTGFITCMFDHNWKVEDHREIIATIRIFEITFDIRFDDEVRGSGIEFTGYNKQKAIAFIHQNDNIPSKCIEAARKWCAKFGVKFIHVEKIETGHIGTEIFKQLVQLDLISAPYEKQLKEIRTRMRAMNSVHKLFDERCVY